MLEKDFIRRNILDNVGHYFCNDKSKNGIISYKY